MATADQFPILEMDESQNESKRVEIIEARNECYNQAIRSWGPWIQEASKDMAFFLGDQWTSQERQNLRMQGRAALVFNKVRRIVKLIEGYERKTRISLIASAVENSDEKTADQITAMLLWQMNTGNFHMTMSDCFAGALKTGMNLAYMSMDYEKDPLSGDVRLDRLAHNSFLLDPRLQRRDLKDCEYILQRKYLSRDAVKALLPFRLNEIDGQIMTGGRDDKFPDMALSKDPNGKELLRFDEFWLRKYRQAKMLVDMETGDMRKWTGQDDERLGLYLHEFPHIKLINRPEQYIELNVLVEDKLMYSGENPWKVNDFPHVPVMAFWEPEFASATVDSDFTLKLQSIVRPIRDSQIEVNKRRSKALDIIDSALNTGWIAKEESVANKDDLYQSGQGKVIWRKFDSDPTDVQRLEPPNVPPGLLQLGELFDKDLMEIAGANSELMGMPENENMPISGILAKVRQGAGLTILQDIFDYWRLAQKLVGGKLYKYMQANFHPSKVRRVLNEEPTKEFFKTDTLGFDISVEEAIETPSQKNLYYMQLMQAKQVGIPIADSLIIESMPIQGKDKILKSLQAQEKKAQEVEQLQMQQQQDLHELAQAEKTSDLANAASKISKMEADSALAQWRITEAQENSADTVLTRIEAAEKIQTMGEDRVLKVAEFLRQLELDSQQKALQQTQANRVESTNKVASVSNTK